MTKPFNRGEVDVYAADVVKTVAVAVDTSAYTAGDLLFDATAVTGAVREAGGCAILQSITIVDKSDQGAAFTLVILDTMTDMGTINSAPDPDDTEAATIIGWIAVAASDYIDVGGADIACIRNIGLLCQALPGSTSLAIAGINGAGTPTYGAAADLSIRLGFLQS
jgi:hypothetical protein